MGTGTPELESSSAAFPRTLAGNRVQQLGVKPLWDGSVSGRELACYITTPQKRLSNTTLCQFCGTM